MHIGMFKSLSNFRPFLPVCLANNTHGRQYAPSLKADYAIFEAIHNEMLSSYHTHPSLGMKTFYQVSRHP